MYVFALNGQLADKYLFHTCCFTLMRHHIVHGYAQIRKDMLWNVVQEDLLPLKSQIENIISETNWDEWEK